MKKFALVCGAATIALMASAASAATLYSTQGSFLTAAGGGLSYDNFEGPLTVAPTSVVSGPVTFSCAGVSFCPGFFGSRTFIPGNDGPTTLFFASPDTATFTFASAITSFGVDLLGFGSSGTSTLTMTVNGTGYNLGTFSTSSDIYSGIIDLTGFTTVTFSGTANGDGIDFDRLHYGITPASGGVPEPATWALMLLGFAAVGASMRRKQAAKVRFAF